MNSCLYECLVVHLRTRPRKNRFSHKVFMFYVDLDEIDRLCRHNGLLGHNCFKPFSFYDRDHLPFTKGALRDNLILFLRSREVSGDIGRIMLLSNWRAFGYVFNPLSVYFCFDKEGEPLCAVGEIHNTFGEIKPFLVAKTVAGSDVFADRQDKFFYISPFSDLDLSLDFRFEVPGEKLTIAVDDVHKGEKTLYASLTGTRKPLSVRNLIRFMFCFPLMGVQVMIMIHVHALILFLRKFPFHMKEEHPHLQKEVFCARNKN